MSSRRTISNTFTVTTMDDPVSVQAQYSPDKTVVHTVWQAGDLYMRTRESDSSAWSSWHKIVGESGDETDYTFNISKEKTSSSSTTAPSNCYYNTWQDAPIAPTSTYPYLWMKVVKKTWNESTQSYDSGTPSYARVTGEAGANAPYIELSRTTIIYQANNEGKSTASQNFPITYALKVNGNTCTISSVNNITISLPTNVTVVSGTKTTSGCTINCTHSVVMSGVITITITGTYNGISYTATGSITVSDSREGPQGEQGEQGIQGIQGAQGKIGRFYYYAQEWVDSSNVSYSVTDTEAPFFAYNNNYWVFNPTANGSYSMHDMGAPSSSSVNWKLMVTDFKFIIAQAIFSNYAHLGSFIVNGDWLLAQYGKVNNVASANYQAFDPLFPKTAYLCQGVACDVNYQNINKHTFTAGKTYNITLIGENFYRDSGITAQMILNVRMYNGSSNVGSTINLTPSNPTQVLEFTPPSTGDYYLRVDMQSGGTHGTLTAFVNNVFIPNYAVDGLSGKTYQKEGYFGGVIESEDTEQGNKIVLDVANGGFKMIGPRSIRDDDHKPSGNSRETLAEINFAHDPDTLTRLAYMDLRDGHDNHVIELDPFYGVHISDNVLGDDHAGAGLGTDGFSCHSGEGSNFKSVVINEYGVTIYTGSSSTSKTWEEIFNNN